MAIVVVRYTQEATNQSFILAQDAAGDASTTLHDAFEEYLVGGWTTEILAYHRYDLDDYADWTELERREERAHAWD